MKINKRLREIVLYGVIGGACALIDMGVFTGLTTLFSLNTFIANLISVNIGICCSFFLNAYINFRKTDNLGKRAVIFWIVGYIGLLLSMLILYIGVEIMEINELIIKLISIIIVAIFQYLINSLLTFSKKLGL